ncbi:hypothetical protein SAMN00777080_1836 [Aquiflexum balticum DSM 16537]|uniref:Uncharacterized protein n=1 Tax=Aquiflexum balticum DSM 16537 TaxID=758820 RepID=A0A1W2H2X5_9BACT|nr:hypothetical protein SAMN00777080_1836 [Aquiflexum balticum DSM 16537]
MKGKKDDLTYPGKRNTAGIHSRSLSFPIYRMISYSNKKWNSEIRIPSYKGLINRCLKILIFNAVRSKPRLTFTNKIVGFLKFQQCFF